MRPEFHTINEIFLFKVDTVCESWSFKCAFAQLEQTERKMYYKCVVCFNNCWHKDCISKQFSLTNSIMKLHELRINGQISSYLDVNYTELLFCFCRVVIAWHLDNP